MTELTKLAKKVLTALTWITFLNFFAFIASNKLQANVVNKLTIEKFSELHQCAKKFNYEIYFLGNKVGYLQRTIEWHNNNSIIDAVVKSDGEVTFLWLDSTYKQQSLMHYSPTKNHFLTPSFSQKLTGIKAREMTANIADDGRSSTVILNTEVTHYQQKAENHNQPLYDLDTLGTQIRLNLLEGKKRFTLSRQASSKIESYQFEVVGYEVIEHKEWGKLRTIKVIEVGEHENMALWFSDKHDHQMVKAELDMMFSPLVWLTHFSKQCDE